MDLDKILSDIENEDISSETDEITKLSDDPFVDTEDLIPTAENDQHPDTGYQSTAESTDISVHEDEEENNKKDIEDEEAEKPEPENTTINTSRTVQQTHTCPGKKSWNTISPYILKISEERVSRDIDKLHNSYYFTDHPVSDAELKEEIKRTLLLFIRKRTGSVLSAYEEFIFKSLITTNRKITEYFNLKDKDGMLLLYHTGVENIAAILLNSFKKDSTGFCFFQDGSGNTVRFLPVEYINSCVIKWFNQNIDIISLPFDSVAELEKIKSNVIKKYLAEEKKFKTRLQIINSKTGPQKKITPEALLKIKGDAWYGSAVMTVFQRFIGKKIFRT